MAGESQRDRRKATPNDERPTIHPPPANNAATPTGLAWIHALALEWEAKASLLRYPQGLSEASLRK
jgi:hypothetical protein